MIRLLLQWTGQFKKLLQINMKRVIFDSHACGMAVAPPYGFEIDFVRNPISGSAAWFFVIILKFISELIFEVKIHEKIPCH